VVDHIYKEGLGHERFQNKIIQCLNIREEEFKLWIDVEIIGSIGKLNDANTMPRMIAKEIAKYIPQTCEQKAAQIEKLFDLKKIRVWIDTNEGSQYNSVWLCISDIFKVLDISSSSDKLYHYEREQVNSNSSRCLFKLRGCLDWVGLVDVREISGRFDQGSGEVITLKMINVTGFKAILNRYMKETRYVFDFGVDVIKLLIKQDKFSCLDKLNSHISLRQRLDYLSSNIEDGDTFDVVSSLIEFEYIKRQTKLPMSELQLKNAAKGLYKLEDYTSWIDKALRFYVGYYDWVSEKEKPDGCETM